LKSRLPGGAIAEVLANCLAQHDAEFCEVAFLDCLAECGDDMEHCNVEHCVANYDLELCSSDNEEEPVPREMRTRGMVAAREAVRTLAD
jgi:hypothetical protein